MNNVHKLALATGLLIWALIFFGCSSDDGGNSDDDSISSSSEKVNSSSSNEDGNSDKGNDIANYKTVVIGTQTWMAENLDYNIAGSKCLDNDPANCIKYGRLYDWETATAICPNGWHLPDTTEWITLVSYIENDKSCTNCDAKYLKSTNDWDSNSLDSYGFAALPGRYGYSDGSFYNRSGFWWSATEDEDSNAYCRLMRSNWEYGNFDSDEKMSLRSVRCVKD